MSILLLLVLDCSSNIILDINRYTFYKMAVQKKNTLGREKAAFLPVMTASGLDCSFLQAGTNTVISLCPFSKNHSTASWIPRQENTSLFPWLQQKPVWYKVYPTTKAEAQSVLPHCHIWAINNNRPEVIKGIHWILLYGHLWTSVFLHAGRSWYICNDCTAARLDFRFYFVSKPY